MEKCLVDLLSAWVILFYLKIVGCVTIQGAPQIYTAPTEVSLSMKTGTVSGNMQSLNIPKVTSAQVAEKHPWKHELSSSKPVNPPDQRTLKVRIKVGSDNTAQKNAAIYSGLGLISPSSSTGNSHEESGGVPFESQYLPGESPSCILQVSFFLCFQIIILLLHCGAMVNRLCFLFWSWNRV